MATGHFVPHLESSRWARRDPRKAAPRQPSPPAPSPRRGSRLPHNRGGGGRPRSPCRVPVPPLTPPHRPCCRSACSPPSPAAPRPPPLLLRRASVSVPVSVSVSVSVPAASPSPPPWRPRSSLRASPRRSRLHGNRR